MKKKVIITADIVFIVATLIPVIFLLAECFTSALNGVIPSGGYYPPDMNEKIYGIEAFVNTFGVYMVWFFPLVILWGLLLLFTACFTAFTFIFANSKKHSA
ncbi:MAG: hypothetical protein J5685_02945 [Clostridiales bacterium]|nr:hypothetical protein [Clostridiales bacterium]